MKKTFRPRALAGCCLLLMPLLIASATGAQSHSMPAPPVEAQATNTMNDMDEMDATMQPMSGGHMDMGPHMKMTQLRPARPGDQQRADSIVRQLRASIEKYRDYQAALADGYKIFLPNVPAPIKHFTNRRYAIEAQFRFDPEHPTSLLYEPAGSGYRLIGAMYTAPRRYSESQLDQRIPLSIAQWHEHVNLCMPPKEKRAEMFGPHPLFGLAGSIATRQECKAAGGRFYPVVFNWMVHVYPFESNPSKVWSLERQMPGHHHQD